MGTISYIPAQQNFLKTLVAGLMDYATADPLSLTHVDVLLPTRRAVRAITDLFLNANEGRPILLPRLRAIADIDDQALDIFVASETGDVLDLLPAIPTLEQQLVLAEMIRASDPEMDFTRALSLADGFLSFMRSVQDEDLTLDGLDHVVAAEFATHWQITLDFLNILRTVWPQYLQSTGRMDSHDRRVALFERLTAVWRQNPPTHPVIVAGVTGSLPYIADFMGLVTTLPQGSVILPGYDPHLPRDWVDALDPQHPQFSIGRAIERMGIARDEIRVWNGVNDSALDHKADGPRDLFLRVLMYPGSETPHWVQLKETLSSQTLGDINQDLKNISVISVDKISDEARVIATIVRQVVDTPGQEVAIITPDRTLATAIIAACARFGVDVNDSAGTPLSCCLSGQFISLVLTLAIQGMRPMDVMALLRHPYFNRGDIDDRLIHEFEISFLRGLKPPVDPDLFLSALSQYEDLSSLMPMITHLADTVRTLGQKIEKGGPIRDLVCAHLETAALLVQKDSDDYPLLWQNEDGEVLSKIFQDILSIDVPLSLASGTDYATLISDLIGKTPVNRRGVGHPRVSLLGVYEARLTRAEHVILAGFNEGFWPGNMMSDPWLSRGMRHDFGLPPLEQTIGRMAHDLFQFMHAPRLTMTYHHKQSDGLALPSRWLLRFDALITALFGKDHSKCRDYSATHLLSLLDTPDQKINHAYHRPAPRPALEFRPTTLSATQVETLMTDPYALYAQKILRVRPLDPLDQEPDDRIRGILLHDILNKVIANRNARYIDPIIDQSFDALYIDAQSRALIEPRLRQVLFKTLDYSDDWARSHGAIPDALETTWRMTIPNTSPSVSVTARLDRLDRLRDGSYAVIDYKTGANIPPKKDVDAGVACQLIVQTLCVQQGQDDQGHAGGPVKIAALWQLKTDGVHPLSFENDDQFRLEELCVQAQDGLERVLKIFQDDNTPYYPLPNPAFAPEQGRYDHLSRRQVWWGIDTDPVHHSETGTS